MNLQSSGRQRRLGRVSVYTVSLIMLAVGGAPATMAAQGAIEEIVVTGSYIRRQDSFDLATPIEVMDQIEIAERGKLSLGEIIRDSTYNYGVATVTNILGAVPQGGATPAANFRGLGAAATLTLLDGRRTASSNLGNLYPQILISRVESLTGGGSVIYGTDAVGGVLNIIPRREFEGLEVRGAYNSATQGNWDEAAWSIIGGGRNETTSFVGAFEYRDRDDLQFFDRKQYSLGGFSFSNVAWPGNYSVPQRLPVTGGAITPIATAATAKADPGCGANNESNNKADGVLARRQGVRLVTSAFTDLCLWEFGQNFNYQPETETWTSVAIFEHQFTENVGFYTELLFNRLENTDRGSPSNPGGRQSELPVIPGEHPGNPFRAFVDVNGNGRYEPAGGDQLLFAQYVVDGQGDPVFDDLGRMIPVRDPVTNQVLLAPNQFASLDDDPVNGGIPFNEDVIITNWRPVGYPFVGPSRSNRDGTGRGDADLKANNYRWTGGVRFDIPDTTWSGFGEYTYHRNIVDGPGGRVESLSAIAAGLTGQLLVRDEATGASRRTWFNPFASQNFVCENRDCSGGVRQPLTIVHPITGETIPNPAVNHPEVYDVIARFEPINIQTTLNTARIIVDGQVAELPAGPLSAAVGVGWSRLNYKVDAGATWNALDAWIAVGSPDYSEGRTSYSSVLELSVPVFESPRFGRLELQPAVRSEWISDNSNADLDHTDYQFAVRWQVRDWIALRGSWSTAFISPSLPDLFAPSSQMQLSNISDQFFTGTTGFLPRTLGGNPNLQPEEADIYNFGLSLLLLDGSLNVSFDWKYFDFEDRIIRAVPQELVNDDRDAYIAAGFATEGAGATLRATDLAGWLASGQADPRIVRNPITGFIDFVDTPLLNAQEMEWKGFDLSASYRFEGSDLPFVNRDIGQFSVGFTSTYIQNYSFIRSAGGRKFEGAGKRNNGTAAVPPSPRWRANARLSWDLDRHQVVVLARYMHHVNKVDEEDGQCVRPPSAVATLMGVTNGCPTKFPKYMEWDVQYNLNLDGLVWGDRSTSVSLGLINAFDKEPKAINTLGGLETFLYDPRGRIWYARLTQQL
jgi:iron complex outermembrane recepter protein